MSELTDADRRRVAELLGREPGGAYEIVVRNELGDPVVLCNAPLLESGRPMPTRYWLVGDHERRIVGRIESDGGVRRSEAEIPAAEIEAAHERYRLERDAGGRPRRQVPARPLRLVSRRRRRSSRPLGGRTVHRLRGP